MDDKDGFGKDGYGIQIWMTRTDMGYRDEGQGWIWDREMDDKDGYGIHRWMTRTDMGNRDG